MTTSRRRGGPEAEDNLRRVPRVPAPPTRTVVDQAHQPALAVGGEVPAQLIRSQALLLQRSAGNQAFAAVVQRGKKKGAKAAPERGKGGKGKKAAPTPVVVEEDDTDEDQDAEEAATPVAADSAAGMAAAYDQLVAALKTKVSQFKAAYPATALTSALGKARLAVVTVRSAHTDVSDLVDQIELRRDEVDAAMDDADGDEMETLVEEESAFGALLRKAWKAAQALDDEVTELEGSILLAGQAAAAGAELTRLRGLWTSPAQAVGHFGKHTADTGIPTEQAYLAQAEALTNKAAGGTVSRKVRSDGDVCWFDSANGQFAVKSSAGRIRTLFCPAQGRRYYDRQA